MSARLVSWLGPLGLAFLTPGSCGFAKSLGQSPTSDLSAGHDSKLGGSIWVPLVSQSIKFSLFFFREHT
jgi:hypothetical protein